MQSIIPVSLTMARLVGLREKAGSRANRWKPMENPDVFSAGSAGRDQSRVSAERDLPTSRYLSEHFQPFRISGLQFRLSPKEA